MICDRGGANVTVDCGSFSRNLVVERRLNGQLAQYCIAVVSRQWLGHLDASFTPWCRDFTFSAHVLQGHKKVFLYVHCSHHNMQIFYFFLHLHRVCSFPAREKY